MHVEHPDSHDIAKIVNIDEDINEYAVVRQWSLALVRSAIRPHYKPHKPMFSICNEQIADYVGAGLYG